jgi:hypothetical protein
MEAKKKEVLVGGAPTPLRADAGTRHTEQSGAAELLLQSSAKEEVPRGETTNFAGTQNTEIASMSTEERRNGETSMGRRGVGVPTGALEEVTTVRQLHLCPNMVADLDKIPTICRNGRAKSRSKTVEEVSIRQGSFKRQMWAVKIADRRNSSLRIETKTTTIWKIGWAMKRLLRRIDDTILRVKITATNLLNMPTKTRDISRMRRSTSTTCRRT